MLSDLAWLNKFIINLSACCLIPFFFFLGASVKEFCQCGTVNECMRTTGHNYPCDKLHFKKIIHAHTDGTIAYTVSYLKKKLNLKIEM